LSFAASAPGKTPLPPLSFAWLVAEDRAFAAASKNGDATLKTVIQAASGERDTLGSKAGIGDSVQRVGQHAALFAYLDARAPLAGNGARAEAAAPLLLSLGKQSEGAALRLEISKAALDLALSGALGH